MPKKKLSRLEQILEIPRELNHKISKITIISFDELLIENYKGILEYEEFYIKINTEIGTVNINGFNLTLEQITEDDVAVKGIINSIDLDRIMGWYIVYKNTIKLHIRICTYKGWKYIYRKIYKYMYKQKNFTVEYEKRKGNYTICKY